MEQPNKNATAPRHGSSGARQTTVTANYTGPLTKAERIARAKKYIDEVNTAAVPSMAALLERWLPDGKQRGKEWIAKNPTRQDNHAGSFCINVYTGQWIDYATDDKGADPVSLAAYLFGMGQHEAAREMSQMLGVHHG